MRIHFIQHVAFETPGYLLQWAREHQHTVSFTLIYESPVFPDVNGIDWLIVMGGPMGVYQEDQYAWMKPEKEFIRAVIKAGKKVLGICLGSQLVAEALGAKVYPLTQKEIGWWPVKKTGNVNSAITDNLPDEFTSFHWHGDTFDLPAGAVHLLQTDACPHQAFLYDNRVMGLQFHMEAQPEQVKAMAEHGKEELIKSGWIQAENEILSNKQYYKPNNQWMDGLLQAFSKQ
jgi:GMP synthase-like glutamine amidotransferase